jgi:hypothetical protein
MLGNFAMLQPPSSLPSNRAFVLQFRTQPADAPLSWEGRVEHLTSGQALRFHTPEELLAFVARVLNEVQESSCIE